MRVKVGWLAAWACVSPACFKEPPIVPDEGTTAATSSEAPTSGTDSASSTGADDTSTGPVSSPTEFDVTGGTAVPPDEGLFACTPVFCEAWTLPPCKGPCGKPDAAGSCLLEQLRDRADSRGDVRDCGDSCERTVLAIRGGGTDEVERQTAVEVGEGLANYTDLKVCVLRDPAFFSACLLELTPECLDIEMWFDSCVDQAEACE